MSQSLNSIPAFDGSNYRYWKARICFFLKFIDVRQIVEIGWTNREDTTAKLSIVLNKAQLSNDKALHALCQTLSPSKFARISNLRNKI
jgi:hypothetical protein